MKCIMVMFDTLNRRHLSPYNPDTFVHTPNFQRLSERAVTFENSYVCSMPCMPARRDLHTGRPNFLHRGWGPLEPFDDSVPQMLRDNGISSHLFSDHQHYWEDGGGTYHTRYSTWEFFRGQEGDPWKAVLDEPTRPSSLVNEASHRSPTRRQDWANRGYMRFEEDQPQAKTFRAGLDFIRQNHQHDNWFCQIETFDPHEPFFTQQHYKDVYAEHFRNYRGKFFDWPTYGHVKETPEEVEHCCHEYAALMTMCDAYIGRVLSLMDELSMWEDTMLIVCTDHGFMLGEHDSWAKCWLPFYQEIAHTPFWVWDPRSGKRGERRESLVQPAIDIGPTVLEFFGIDRTPDMLGQVLRDTLADDKPVRDHALFGIFGGQVNVTDGRYVYMRGTEDWSVPRYEYTLMPTRMRSRMSVKELAGRTALADPFSFTKGCSVMRIGGAVTKPENVAPQAAARDATFLWDTHTDYHQQTPMNDAAIEKRMIDAMVNTMQACDAPPEQYQRLGLAAPA